MKPPLFLVMVLLCVLGRVGSALSATWDTQELHELAQRADLILSGTVQSIRSEWNESETMIYTYIEITPNTFIKNTTEGYVTLKLLGGRVGEIATVALGFPEFKKNNEVLLFLKEGKDNPYHWIIGPSKGKFDINTKSGTNDKYVTQKGIPQASMRLSEFISLVQKQQYKSELSG